MKLKSKKIIIIVLFFIAVTCFMFIRPWYVFLTKTLHISPIATLVSSKGILKTTDDQVTIVILGIAGVNYEGPNLSDSIIVENYNFQKNTATTIGIPRDIWSDTLKDKINSAYAYGEAKQKGGGLILAKSEIGAIIDLPVHYAVVIDFDKFKEIINDIGGIDIYVENTFVDTKFPIPGKENDLCNGDQKYKCRYETLSFKKGTLHMNGETALKFVRSRNAEGSEGNDFARERRQQKVFEAIMAALIKKAKQNDIKTLTQTYNHINAFIQRDITNEQVAVIAKHIFINKTFILNKYSLPMELFEVPDYSNYEGKYVLIPKDNNPQIVFNAVRCFLRGKKQEECVKLKPLN